MKRIIIIIFVLFNSILLFSQKNKEKDFYNYLVTNRLIDSTTEYSDSKVYFLDSLFNFMNTRNSYELPKICPNNNQVIQGSHETSRCFIEEELFCNLYLDYKIENYSNSFDDLLHIETINDIISQKKFRYFCCKFISIEFYDKQVYVDPLTGENRVVGVPESYSIVLILFYD